MQTKTYGWIALVVVAAFSAGWVVGASGRAAVALELGRAEERGSFLEARALVFEGRVDLLVNEGNAGRRFAEAREVVERVQTRLRESGQAERAGQLAIALEQLNDAEQRAAAGDDSAQSVAETALQTLRFVETFESSR